MCIRDRGPTGEVWRLEENLYPFVELVRGVLSDQPLFVILNSYTTGLAPSVVTYIPVSYTHLDVYKRQE